MFGTFYKNNYPSKTHVIVFVSVLLFFSLIILLFFYDALGKLMSVIGAGTGLVLIYFIPLVVNIVYYRVKHPKGELRNQLMAEQCNINNDVGDTTQSPTVYSNTYNEILNAPHAFSTKPPSELKDLFFYISQISLMVFGLFCLVIQFVPINFFNIHLQ